MLFGLALVAVPVPYWIIEGGRVPVVWLVAVAGLVVTSAVRQGGSVSAQIAQWLAIQAGAAVVVAYLIGRLGAAVLRWVVPAERHAIVVAAIALAAAVAMCSPIYTSSAVHDGTPTNFLGILALR